MKFLVTGSAGFIGFHVASRLLQAGHDVLGIDNFSEYYDVALKEQRNDILSNHANFRVARVGVDDMAAFGAEWESFRPDVVIHLAAQAGVRYSIDHPETYVQANLIGTFNVLELARRTQPRHLLAASTSSVYGANTDMPFDEGQKIATPLTFYAATKGATELMGHSYAHLFGVPITFFRFFTVYGPWGRPDMALFKFAKAIDEGKPLDVYNRGDMVRDFTYVEDLAEAVVRLADAIPGREPVDGDSLSPVAPWRVVNIGQGEPVKLMNYIAEIERAMGKPAILNLMPMQPGDVPATEASAELLQRLTGYAPSTPLSVGVPAFVRWYRDNYSGRS
ncbi:NAD-dependent epimerase/dehydratase family protein [Sphingomonas panacisoli]|uniref:NAD-dependent epimerase/dehydratase family protein n=1 Tax=Sphingomonas panacisoli TaxID=1813879 RepID=A0A5B8LGQ3_9SPHN|nr:NAD-dependent epimerase/dehydratase family protein [Sphingomonas panacisoli]QDZ06975.1 NAD-dependent epimerase/dehydratase family protein [Sphingomonas panacisoli]